MMRKKTTLQRKRLGFLSDRRDTMKRLAAMDMANIELDSDQFWMHRSKCARVKYSEKDIYR